MEAWEDFSLFVFSQKSSLPFSGIVQAESLMHILEKTISNFPFDATLGGLILIYL